MNPSFSLYFSAIFENIEIIVKFGPSQTYFHPKAFIAFMQKTFNLRTDEVVEKAASILKCFIFCGTDSNPGFTAISHSFALNIFWELIETRTFKNEEDFLFFAMKVYQQKNVSIKRLFYGDSEVNLNDNLMNTRQIIKSMQGSENLTLPLPSVLDCSTREQIFFLNIG